MQVLPLTGVNINRLGHTARVGLQASFEAVARELQAGRVAASFYPYAELRHSWRRRPEGTYFRVSDYLDSSSEAILSSLAGYLLSKASRDECPPGRADAYLAHSRSREMWQPKKELYLSRARSLSLCAKGDARDLSVVFDYVNACYFEGRFGSPLLAWASESPSRRLGFYFEPLDLMAVNKVLDSPSVPRYVLEFVMYHELLHCALAPRATPSRHIYHTSEFRERERAFSMYEDAERWLRRLAADRRVKKSRGVVPRA